MRVREDLRVLDGRLAMDDACLRGELAGGKPGSGSENKVSLIAFVQTPPAQTPRSRRNRFCNTTCAAVLR